MYGLRYCVLQVLMTYRILHPFAGGTTDITFYMCCKNGKLERIHSATGVPCGGRNINEAFFDFLKGLFGKSVIDELKTKEYMEDYLDLEREFEIKKRTISSNKTGMVKMTFPLSIFQLAGKIYEKDLRSVCEMINKNAKYCGKIRAETQKLQISTEILISLFLPTIKKIIDHIRTTLMEKIIEVKNIVMVGGFAECDIVYSEFRKVFMDQEIYVPEEAGLAVLKGAVLYGHMPQTELKYR